MNEREQLQPAVVIALGVITIGFILTGFSVVSMRMAYHRAYAEIASSCERVSLVIVGDAKYFCAPVARLEMVDPASSPERGAVPRPEQGPKPERTQSAGRTPSRGIPGIATSSSLSDGWNPPCRRADRTPPTAGYPKGGHCAAPSRGAFSGQGL